MNGGDTRNHILKRKGVYSHEKPAFSFGSGGNRDGCVPVLPATALAANEPADTAASEPTQQTEVVTADTDTGSEKGALAKYSDFITSTGGELLVVGICAVSLGALYLTKGKKGRQAEEEFHRRQGFLQNRRPLREAGGVKQ